MNSEHARTNYCIYSDVDRLLCLGGFGDKNDGALVNVPYREMEFEGL